MGAGYLLPVPVVTSRDLRMVYDVVGDGPPVVFLHGISNHRWAWAPQIATVARLGHRAVLVDLAGHGQSDPVVETTTTGQLANDVVSLLDELGEAQAVVCGLSLGGMVALQLLVDHPDRARAALVASTGPMLTFPGAAEIIGSWNELWRSENGPVRRLDNTWPLLTTERFRDSAAGRAFYDSWRRTLSGVSGESLAAVATGLLQFDVTAELPSAHTPVVVVAGEFDRLAPPDMVRSVADLIPGSRLEVVADSGHLVNLERPDVFNTILSDLLATSR